jgi:poly(A) polymerase
MKRRFAPAPLYQRARDIIQSLRAAGHEAYIAGGAVRDYLLGRAQTDLDIATSARPDEVRALFPRTFAVGESFGVIIVRHRGREFEVATFREECDYQDGRHPGTVRYSTAQADVARRDFTINGMLWDTDREEVLDWVGGRADVAAGVIRTIGPPEERFAEDRLRMLRALRFAAQLDFTLEPATLSAIRSQASSLRAVSLERVRQELDKLLAAPAARLGVDLLTESGLGEVLRGWLREEARGPQDRRELHLGTEASWDWLGAWLERAEPLAQDQAAPMSGLLCLLLDVAGHPSSDFEAAFDRELEFCLESLMRALRGSRQDMTVARSAAWILCHLRGFTHLRLANQLRLLRRAEAPWLLDIARRHPAFAALPWDEVARVVDTHSQSWYPAPHLSGTDILQLGLPAGPELGRLLHEAESLQLEGQLTSREEALAWLQAQRSPSA